MSDVTFNEEQNLARRYAPASSKKGGVIGLIMRLGIAQTESQANKIMIGIIVVACVAMAFIWLPHGHKTSSVAAPATMPIPGSTP